MQPFRNSDKNKLLNFASGNKALGYGTTIQRYSQNERSLSRRLHKSRERESTGLMEGPRISRNKALSSFLIIFHPE